MANTFYPKAKQAWALGEIDWVDDTIKVQPVDLDAYTYSASHEFLSDLPVGARVGTAATLANKTATNGVLDADDVTFTSLTGPSIEAVVFYADTTVEATSRLLMYFDSGVGLPLTPNSGNVPLVFDNGSNKIAKL